MSSETHRTLRELLAELHAGTSPRTASVFVRLVDIDSHVGGETTRGQTLTAEISELGKSFREDYADCVCIPLLGASRGASLRLTIGRSRQNDIVVKDASVSKHHATLERDTIGADFSLSDETSRNGTFVNSERLTTGRSALLWPGAQICFGNAAFVFIDAATLRKLATLVPEKETDAG